MHRLVKQTENQAPVQKAAGWNSADWKRVQNWAHSEEMVRGKEEKRKHPPQSAQCMWSHRKCEKMSITHFPLLYSLSCKGHLISLNRSEIVLFVRWVLSIFIPTSKEGDYYNFDNSLWDFLMLTSWKFFSDKWFALYFIPSHLTRLDEKNKRRIICPMATYNSEDTFKKLW